MENAPQFKMTKLTTSHLFAGEEASDQGMVLQAVRLAKPIFPSCSLANIRKLEYLLSLKYSQTRIFVKHLLNICKNPF